MLTRPFLVTAAAGVVAATVVPSLAHAWRAPAATGAAPGLAATALQQATPEGTRRLAPSAVESTPLPRGGGLGPGGVSQDVTPQRLGDQAHAQGHEPAQAQAEAAPDLAALFGEPNLALREQHFADIVARATREPELQRALEALADGASTELAWTARLALREVRASSGAAPRSHGHDPFSQLERMFGVDPFDDPTFFTDPFGADPFRGFGGLGGFGRSPFAPLERGGVGPGSDPFERMRSELKRLEELVAPQMQGPLSPGVTPAPRGGVHFQGRSESLSVTPDGVRLEVEEDGPSGRTSRTYEARTLEELYTAHPELRPGGR